MDENSSRFYSAVFSNVLLNLYAVKNGWFDTLICETEDPSFALKWRQSVPEILQRLKQSREK